MEIHKNHLNYYSLLRYYIMTYNIIVLSEFSFDANYMCLFWPKLQSVFHKFVLHINQRLRLGIDTALMFI